MGGSHIRWMGGQDLAGGKASMYDDESTMSSRGTNLPNRDMCIYGVNLIQFQS